MKVTVTASGLVTESEITVDLDDEVVAQLFKEAFDGICPACQNNSVSEGDVICCECMGQAVVAHLGNGCCIGPHLQL